MSEQYTKVASLKELCTGKLMRIVEDEHDICLAYVDGNVYTVG